MAEPTPEKAEVSIIEAPPDGTDAAHIKHEEAAIKQEAMQEEEPSHHVVEEESTQQHAEGSVKQEPIKEEDVIMSEVNEGS